MCLWRDEAQAQARDGVGVLAAAAVGRGNVRGVPAGRDRSQDRLPVAGGERWLPPAQLAEEACGGRYLSLLERQRIATLRRQRFGVREIVDQLGRAPSTVSRELRRNPRPARSRLRRRSSPRPGAATRPTGAQRRLLTDPLLRAEVQAKLELEWSPEQIAAWLRTAYPDQPGRHVCHETIYQALYLGCPHPPGTP
jgi:hypothetical protein